MSAAASIPVTIDTFARAETDLYFSNFVRDGGIGKFFHIREPTPLDQQKIIRMNRDTLYSSAVFDLDAGPVTITMPDPGSRFMSMQVWDEDEYCPLVAYGAGRHTFYARKHRHPLYRRRRADSGGPLQPGGYSRGASASGRESGSNSRHRALSRYRTGTR